MSFLKSKIILSSLIISALLLGCSEDNPSTSPTSGENNPPVIRSVTATPASVNAPYGEETTLSCVATDPEGDSLSYRWNCSSASIDSDYNGTESTVRMNYFREGDNWVRVTVSDGREIDVDSVKVIGT